MVSRYTAAAVARGYISSLASFRLIRRLPGGFRLERPVRSFGDTLEWYVAEVFRRELLAESLWGVKFKGRKTGGDYDVIAKLDCILCYAEVKSSPPKQIYDSEISAFLDRADDLAPDLALFVMDTELRMKDKIVPMFEAALARRGLSGQQVVRLERELFGIGDRCFILNARDSLAGNIRTVIARHLRKT